MSVTPLSAGDEMHAGMIVHRTARRDAIPSGYRVAVHSSHIIAIAAASRVRIWDEIEPDPWQ